MLFPIKTTSQTMENPRNISNSLALIFLVIFSCPRPAHSNIQVDFLQCLSLRIQNYAKFSHIIYTPNDSSYISILQTPIKNLRFTSPSTPKPLLIITPLHEYQIQALVICSKANNLQIRIRSGGHDYEGLSYVSRVPFIIIDLINLSDITVDAEKKTAWVQTGATIGQLYYQISLKSKVLAFPGGTCPTVGVGGHFSGGGYGTLLRKYGLAADHVTDARIINVNGEILDRKSMGEDLFWAIRGGGGASFGVITAWKVNLVSVPEILTVVSINKTLEQNATSLIHRWQFVAPNLPDDLFISIDVKRVNSGRPGEKTILATFTSVFLGGTEKLIELLEREFTELGVRREDCVEVSWIQSVLYIPGYRLDESPKVLANRNPPGKMYFKMKSDYVQDPISMYGLKGIWKLFYEKEADSAGIIMTPYGGKMKEISESAIPFPHREGNLYKMQHLVYWSEPGSGASERYIAWIRRLYLYMAPYVSKFPRLAYFNYKDLDLGVNNDQGDTSYGHASVWGFKYFKNNFKRLVRVKTTVDPGNFFKNEQSIPALQPYERKN